MKLNSKFNVGDEVYFMNNYKPIIMKIKKITYESGKGFTYWFNFGIKRKQCQIYRDTMSLYKDYENDLKKSLVKKLDNMNIMLNDLKKINKEE